ncbi:MAG: septum formation initiator family protein [Candidatus Eisenbacteria bacterium]|uniref:Septum formation initiator family protein n=1 Tax=Eiseniibacteriota bacterium TaxID=2212470 RepID=A0A948WDG9_UNCEI|nr:septum formation initiator family protein [Candidatus Eisenbacteria bacterium]MBU1947313.1 septum formation initiator family protein [Candidatus Eisenbacteria bacterium]MBU2691853.1 septum formation initiator family protein [Candidatus Eisenbacteria bacterium]
MTLNRTSLNPPRWRSTAAFRPPDKNRPAPEPLHHHYRQRDERRGLNWQVCLILVLFLWAGYTALAGPQGLVRLIEVKQYEKSVENEVNLLAAQLDSVKTQLHQLDTDYFLREKTARETYGMARKDELIYYESTDGAHKEVQPGRIIPQMEDQEP